MVEERDAELDGIGHGHLVCFDEEVIGKPGFGVDVEHLTEGIEAEASGVAVEMGSDAEGGGLVDGGDEIGGIKLPPRRIEIRGGRGSSGEIVVAEILREERGEFSGFCAAAGENLRNQTGSRGEEALGAFEPEKGAVVGVAGKRFIAAFARDENFDVRLGQASDVIEGDRRWLADRLFHVLDKAGKKAGEGLRVDGSLVVIRGVARSGEASVGTLVGDLRIGEADRVGAEVALRFCSKTKHSGGVNTAAE